MKGMSTAESPNYSKDTCPTVPLNQSDVFINTDSDSMCDKKGVWQGLLFRPFLIPTLPYVLKE